MHSQHLCHNLSLHVDGALRTPKIFLYDWRGTATITTASTPRATRRRGVCYARGPRRTLCSHECQRAPRKLSVHAVVLCLIRQQREQHCQGLGFRCLVLCVEPELSPCVHLEKHTNSSNNTPIVIPKKILNEPFPAFPPSLRLKEPQTNTTRATTCQKPVCD